MHSFTFSSEKQHQGTRLDRFTIALLATILAVLALTEGVSVIAFDRTSKVHRKELAQRRALLAVKDQPPSATSHVAVLGNSLLLDGVDVALLGSKIQPKFSPVAYFMLGTEYYDWFFGLKRLFAEGMRPRSVLLGLSPGQLISTNTRGDYSARYLFQRSDLLEVARQTHMDPTTASGFVLAHFSEFYSTREVTRGFLINRFLPSVGELLHSRLGSRPRSEIDEAVLKQLAGKRLMALDRLCRENGSHFILVIPPTYEQGAETIAQIGREQAIPVLVPVASQELDAGYYQSDGYHLNDRGARIFTSRLADNLLNEQPRPMTSTRMSR